MSFEIDVYTTSIDFEPQAEKGFYYHKKLDPNKEESWKKDTILLIRSVTSGIDYVVRFLSDGENITLDCKDYEKVKRWRYRAKYEILKRYYPQEEKMRKIKDNLRDEVLRKQEDKCNFCGAELNSKRSYEIDHILEMSFGGKTEFSNLQALCKKGCHQFKTLIFKKAKQAGKIDPYLWKKNEEWKDQYNDFVISLISRIYNGPLCQGRRNNQTIPQHFENHS